MLAFEVLLSFANVFAGRSAVDWYGSFSTRGVTKLFAENFILISSAGLSICCSKGPTCARF